MILFILCIILFECYHKPIEYFDGTAVPDVPAATTANYMVFTTFQDNNSVWIINNIKAKLQITEISQQDPNAWSHFKSTAQSNPLQLYNGSSLFVCDPYDYDNDFSKFKVIGTSDKGYFIGLTSPQTGFHMSCILDIIDKTVGYFDHSDLYFIKAIINGYRLDKSRIHLKQLYKTDYIDLGYTLKSVVDVIITFVIPGSTFCSIIQTSSTVASSSALASALVSALVSASELQAISIMGFGNLDWERLRLFYPYTTKESVPNLSQILLGSSGANALVMSREENTFLPSMRLNVIQLYDTANPPQIVEEFITRLNNDSTYYDPSYRCYGDSNIDNKALCDSPYDVIGHPKVRYTVWDQPCVVDTDCPYFKADIKRGGCLQGGICEFPVGVKGIGFRKNINTGQFAPFCYNCDNAYDTTCCGGDNAAHSDLVFPGDTDVRKKSGQKLTLPIT